MKANVISLLTIIFAAQAFIGCQDSEQSRREQELAHARQIAAIEVEKQKQLAKYRQRQKAAELQQVANAKRELAKELTYTTRRSLLDENDIVLQIRNPNPQSVDLYLRCHSRWGSSKKIFVPVPALQVAEVGFLEGWAFRSGEKFDVIHNGEIIANYTIN